MYVERRDELISLGCGNGIEDSAFAVNSLSTACRHETETIGTVESLYLIFGLSGAIVSVGRQHFQAKATVSFPWKAQRLFSVACGEFIM